MDMRIAKITTYQPIQKISCTQKIKDFLTLKRGGFKLKTLAKDVFDKILPYGLEEPRKLPNSISDPIEEYCCAIGKRIKFSKKDTRKLKQLEGNEYLDFSSKLIEEKRFTIVE